MARTALLIEDVSDQALLVRAMLEIAGGWELVHARTLAEAEQRYASTPVDVVLLDLGLPDAEGDDPLQPLDRALSWRPRPAVLVLTGAVDDGLGERAVDRGAQDFLRKSDAHPDELPRVLDFAVRRHAAVVRSGTRAEVATARTDALTAYSHAISHELREPLASLISMANLAVTLAEQSPQLGGAAGGGSKDITALIHALRRVETLGHDALAFTDDLLEDAGQETSGRRRLYLQALVAEAAALADERHATNVRDRIVIEQLPAQVYGLPGATRRVLTNLLDNASQHADPSAPRILVDGVTMDTTARITVHDNGPGVPLALRSRIFEEGPSTGGRTRRGLANAARQMEHQGGRVWVESSAPLGGAAFVIELPIRARDRAASGASITADRRQAHA